MPIIDAILAEFDSEAANTRKTLERFPAGKGTWKPHAKSFSLEALAGHIATLPSFTERVASVDRWDMNAGDYKPFAPKSGAEAAARFDEESAKARAALARLSDADMAKNWIFAWEGKVVVEMPRGAALRAFCFNHAIHHRGQLTVYYRENDVPVPALYGPSADEQG